MMMFQLAAFLTEFKLLPLLRWGGVLANGSEADAVGV